MPPSKQNIRILNLLVIILITMVGCEQPTAPRTLEFEQKLNQILSTEQEIPQVNLKYGRIGLGLIPRNYDDSVESWLEALSVARYLGVQVLQLPSGYWKEDEPLPDAFQWSAMLRFFDALKTTDADFEVSQDFGGPFFHEKNMAPDFLQPIQLTDPAFKAAYLNYLSSYLELFGDRIMRLLIHAEGAYSYFNAHPDHLESYLDILANARILIKTNWPHVRLGVNIDPHNDPTILKLIAQQVDFVGFDIVQIENLLEKPSDLEAVIEFILNNTSDKPVSLACGWSSAPGLGGGDQMQSDFYQQVFHMLQKHRSRIEYIAVGPAFDENPDIVGPAYQAQFSSLPKAFVSDITDWITQLGLIRLDGSSKPALEVIRKEIRKYYLRQEKME